MGSWAHPVVIIMSAIQVGFFTSSIADGTSLFWLKEHGLGVTTCPDRYAPGAAGALILSQCYNDSFNLRSWVRYPYGIGVLQDMYGRPWHQHGDHNSTNQNLRQVVESLREQGQDHEQIWSFIRELVSSTTPVHHPADFFQCTKMQTWGTVILAFVFMANILAAVQFVTSGIHQVNEEANLKVPSIVIQSLMAAILICATAMVSRMYTRSFDCNNHYVMRIQLKDHFEANYGVYFIGFGFLLSIINLVCVLVGIPDQPAAGGEYAPSDNEDDTMNDKAEGGK